MAGARLRRRDKQLVELVQQNAKLHRDIADLEEAYLMHKRIVDEDQSSLQGLIRKEVGGSRWEHGGAGKLRTYKSNKDLEEGNQGQSLAVSQGPREKKKDIGTVKSDKRNDSRTNGVNNVCDNHSENLNLSGRIVNPDRILDLKTKVLKKAGSKIIRRDTWANGSDSEQTEHKIHNTAVLTNARKAINKVANTGNSKSVKRSNSQNREVRETSKTGKKKNESSVKTQGAEHKDNRQVPKQSDSQPTESSKSVGRQSRLDLYRSSESQRNRQSLSRNGSVERSVRQKQGTHVDTEEAVANDRVSTPIGRTYTPRKIENYHKEGNVKSSQNIFQTELADPDELYIDPRHSLVRLKPGSDNYVNDVGERTKVLIQPGSVQNSLEENKIPCSIVDNNSGASPANEIRDIFGLGTFEAPYRDSRATSVNGSSVSPFAATKGCNSEVEFWLRGLSLPDVDRYVKLFADHEIDLCDLEFMTAAQLHEMGVTAIGALDKILKGVRDIRKGTGQLLPKAEKGRRKGLSASSIAWEEDSGSTQLKRTYSVRKSVEGDQVSCRSADFLNSDRGSVRCSSAMSNVSESKESVLGSRYAAETRSSSAKVVEKRPPSAKMIVKNNSGNQSAGKKSNSSKQGNTTLKRSNSNVSDRQSSKLNQLDSKPSKGVLLRPRSSSLSREATRPQPKKGKKSEEKDAGSQGRGQRFRSRSVDAVKRKAMEGVQAAARRFEDQQRQRSRGSDQYVPRDEEKKKQRRNRMAARHQERIRGEMEGMESSETEEEELSLSEPHSDNMVTVNIISRGNNTSDPGNSGNSDQRNKTKVLPSRPDVRKSLRRVEPARHQLQQFVKPVELQMALDTGTPLLSTYTAAPREQSRERDRVLSEPESGYRTDGSTTYTQIEDRVCEIQQKIKRLKARATSGDEMTLTLVRDLQGQLVHFEKLLMDKESDKKGQGRSGSSNQGSSHTFQPIHGPSQPSPRANSQIHRPSQPSPRASSHIHGPSHPSPRANSSVHRLCMSSPQITSPRASSPIAEVLQHGGKGHEGEAQGNRRRELLEEMRREKKQHKQARSEPQHIDHHATDPVWTMELDPADIQYCDTDVVGEGTFSQVFRGRYQGAEVAIKRLRAPLQQNDRNYFTAEVSLMKELRHPRVVLLIGVCTACKLPLMVIEFMSRGSLFNHLHNPDCEWLDHVQYYQVARDVAAGMNYLHSHKPQVLHLDLKSMNVLLCQSLRAKIADFGFSKLRHDAGQKSAHKGGKARTPRSIPMWMSPELLDKGEVTGKSDVYSFAVILWEMLTREIPYSDCSLFQVLERVRKNRRPMLPRDMPPGLAKLISQCWDANPAKRPQFKEIVQTLELLAFPPAWRELFQEAGIPESTLQDVQSARTIISLVTNNLDPSHTGHNFMIRPPSRNTGDQTVAQPLPTPRSGRLSARGFDIHEKMLDLPLSGRNSSREVTKKDKNSETPHSGRTSAQGVDVTRSQTVILANGKNSAREVDDPDHITSNSGEQTGREEAWDCESVSTLSGRVSPTEFRLQNLQENSADEDNKDVDSDDSSVLSTDVETIIPASSYASKPPMDVLIPNLELSLRTAREEFKAEREKIDKISNWFSISLDDKSYRSESERSQGANRSSDVTLNLTSGRSSRSVTPLSVTEREGHQLNESARSKRRNKSRDLPLYSEEYLMRESFYNRRPPSPKKQLLMSQTLSEHSSLGLDCDLADTDNPKTSGLHRSESFSERSSKTQATINDSFDSFFGINLGGSIKNKHFSVSDKKLTQSNIPAPPAPEQTSNEAWTDTAAEVKQEKTDDSEGTRVSSGQLDEMSSSQLKDAKNITDDCVDVVRSSVGDVMSPADERKLDSDRSVASLMSSVNEELRERKFKVTKKPRNVNDSITPATSVGKDSTDTDSGQSTSASKEIGEYVAEFVSEKDIGDNVSKMPEISDTQDITKENKELSVNKAEESRHITKQSLEHDKLTSVGIANDSVVKEQIRVKLNVSNASPRKKPAITPRKSKIFSSVSKSTEKVCTSNIPSSENVDNRNKDSVMASEPGKVVRKDVDNSVVVTGEAEKQRDTPKPEHSPKTVNKVAYVVRADVIEKRAAGKLRDSVSESMGVVESTLRPAKQTGVTGTETCSVDKAQKKVNSSSKSREFDNLTSTSSIKSDESGLSNKQLREQVKKPDNSTQETRRRTEYREKRSEKEKVKERRKTLPANIGATHMTEDVADNVKAKNSIRVKLRKDPLAAEKQNNSRPVSGSEKNKDSVRVQLMKDPLAPTLCRDLASPVPPPPPPPPPPLPISLSLAALPTQGRSQTQKPSVSMADELRTRLSGRQSFTEGVPVGNRNSTARPVKRENIVGLVPSSTQIPAKPGPDSGEPRLVKIPEDEDILMPQQSDGLPSFMVQSLELRDQKDHLRSITKPHPDQLDDLTGASKEKLSSIAEILKKAVLGRRLAMGEDGDSVSQSLDSCATGWSVDTGI